MCGREAVVTSSVYESALRHGQSVTRWPDLHGEVAQTTPVAGPVTRHEPVTRVRACQGHRSGVVIRARDTWGYYPEVQWLANRGYLCVQVTYRGSTGYSKSFVNAGDREWAGRMHDDNDPRVLQAESESIVAALKDAGVVHEYLLFPDEGHGFVKPENRLRFFAAVEDFLARYLGGQVEE